MVIQMQNEVKVTRKFQVTIPESVRAELDVKIGDKLIVKSENNRIVMEHPQRVTNPSETLWCLFGKPMDIDAVELVEQSWESNTPATAKKRSAKPKEVSV